MGHWVTDITDLPGEDDEAAPAAARARAALTRAVVEAATSRAPSEAWPSAVQCIVRRGRKVRGERIEVTFSVDQGEVERVCLACGERGVVAGFAGTEADLSGSVPRGRAVPWGVDDEELEVLWEGTRLLPELRAVIARAMPQAEVPGCLLISARVRKLDDVHSLVEALTDGTRSRRRRRLELPDGLRASLRTSMDGF